MNKKLIVMLGWVMGLASVALAVPQIAIDRVQQRYPWNGMVDIDYTVSGVEDPSQFHIDFSLTRSNGGGEVELKSFTDVASILSAPNGKRRVTWDSAGDGQAFFDANVTFKATLVADGGEKPNKYTYYYLIVDLSGGANAESYPVTKVYTDEPASDFNTDEYKTTKLVLRRVEPGTYHMGTTPNDQNKDTSVSWLNKETRHQVTITKPFMLGLFEVTQKQYALVMGGTSANDTYPVGGKTYSAIRGATDGCDVAKLGLGSEPGAVDENSFMGKLRAKTGLDAFDLPTEGQWEYACRAGTDVETYTVGGESKSLSKIAVSGGTSQTTVGSKLPNDWGFYDMLGNVWELCRDRVKTAQGAGNANSDDWGSAAVTDPIRTTANGTCPTRGGSAAGGANRCRSAIRGGNVTTSTTDAASGFRVGYMGL